MVEYLESGSGERICLRDLLWALQDLKNLIDMAPPGAVMHCSGREARETEGYRRASALLLSYAPQYFEGSEGDASVQIVGFTAARLSAAGEPFQELADLLRDVRVALSERGIQVLRTTTFGQAELLRADCGGALDQGLCSGKGCKPSGNGL